MITVHYGKSYDYIDIKKLIDLGGEIVCHFDTIYTVSVTRTIKAGKGDIIALAVSMIEKFYIETGKVASQDRLLLT